MQLDSNTWRTTSANGKHQVTVITEHKVQV